MRIRIEAFANTLDTTRSLRLQRAAYRDFLINRLLNYEYVNASNIMTTAPFLKNNILEAIRLMLQRAFNGLYSPDVITTPSGSQHS